PGPARLVYDVSVRLAAIVCVLFAGARASAQVPVPPPHPGSPDPTAEPASPSQPASPTGPSGVEPPPPAVPRQALAPGSAAESARGARQRAEESCAARDPGCDWIAALSSLERGSVARALAARGYEPDPLPWGKVIGAIRIYNEEVFAEPSPFLRFFNHFHVTTKESTIHSEAVVRAGEVWDQERIEE